MIKKILKEVFGFDSFKGEQENIIQTILQKKDTVVLMPTGGGKSLCFQIPALVFKNTSIIISPLISLMQDQVLALKQNGVDACYVNSSLSSSEREETISNIRAGKYKLVYLSPETLSSAMQTWLRDIQVDMVAIDEAHCISMWGHDFRPEYAYIKELRNLYSNIPFVALTATADKLTRQDIVQQLGLINPTTFITTFDRPNIHFKVRHHVPKKEKIKEILHFIASRPEESGIIYCLSRKETEEMAQTLLSHGITCDYYHAGMSIQERTRVQHQFQNDIIPIICATIAFGMGIDKSNVRWVIHNNLPKNIEGYYQEIGRAGRDGMNAEAVLYYNYRDVKLLADFANDGAQKDVLLEKLNRMLEFAETSSCRRKVLLAYFSESLQHNCNHCDICDNPPHYIDGRIIAQKAISAVLRSNETLSTNLLIDVLRGASTSEIHTKNLNALKTYGAGKDLSWKQWQHFISELKNLGVFETAYDDQMHLKATGLAKKVVYDNASLNLTELQAKENITAKKTDKYQASSELSLEEQLFNRLKVLRKQLANEQSIPAYLVFSDASLNDMAKKMPLTHHEFLEVMGVGRQKSTDYGTAFIKVISEFKQSADPKKSTYQETFELYEVGKTVEEIARIRNLKPVTIYSHFANIYQLGWKIDLLQLISIQEIGRIQVAIEQVGSSEALKPIYEFLKEEIDYGKIRLGIAYLNKAYEGSKVGTKS